MTFWKKLIAFDGRLRRFSSLFIVTPFCLLALPIGLFLLVQSYSDYRRLEQNQMHTTAVIQKIEETGGRQKRNAVTSTFKAQDGNTYVSKALYGIEGSKHLRAGMKLGVVYERARPSNNAPTLAYARHQIYEVKIYLGFFAALSALLLLINWKDYASLYRKMRGTDQCPSTRHCQLA